MKKDAVKTKERANKIAVLGEPFNPLMPRLQTFSITATKYYWQSKAAVDKASLLFCSST